MDGQHMHDNNMSTDIFLLTKDIYIPGPMDKQTREVNFDYLDRDRCKACNTCCDIERTLHETCVDNSYEGRKMWKQVVDLYLRHDPETHITAPAKTTHTGNGTHEGWFAGTLTKTPDDPRTEDDMVLAINKIMSQQTCVVDKYAWYLEYTDKGTPHIHFIYITPLGGRIHAKVFKRYWKDWDEKRKLGKGHQGGYHAPVRSDIAYKEYIAKDSGRSGGNISSDIV